MQRLNFLYTCLLFWGCTHGLQAQTDLSLQASICVQDAYSLYHIIDASIVVQQLDKNRQVIYADSLRSNIYATLYMLSNQNYRIRIQKEGYHLIDTTLLLLKTSRSRHKRMGFLLRPYKCHYLQASIVDVVQHQPIQHSRVHIQSTVDTIPQTVQLQENKWLYCGDCTTKYRVIVCADGYFSDTTTIHPIATACLEREATYHQFMVVLQASYPVRFFKGDTLDIPQRLFKTGASELLQAGKYEIERMIKVLQLYPSLQITICLQASAFQQTRYNRRLAEQRARYIERYLDQKGISPRQYLLKCIGLAPQSVAADQLRIWKRSS